MAAATETGSSSKRALVADVNLIPFIDLLSVCICFLLITAVWVQLGILEVKQSQGTSAAVENGGFEIGMQLLSPTTVQMELRKNGRVQQRKRVEGQSLQELQTAVANIAQSFRARAKNQVNAALLTPSANVDYGYLVALMDTLRNNDITNLGVLAVGGSR